MLTPAQVRTFRTTWVPDLIEDRDEWGSAPTLGANASAQDDVIALAGLGAGTIAAGTEFVLNQDGKAFSYFVRIDASISSNAASIAIQPRLRSAVASGAAVSVKPKRRGPFAQFRGRVYRDDPQLQDLARRAGERWTAWITTQYNRDDALFTSMRLLALEEMLADATWEEAARAMDPGGTVIDRMQKQLERDRVVVQVRETGAGVIRMTR